MNNKKILNASDIDSKNKNVLGNRPIFIKPDNSTLFMKKPENNATIKKPISPIIKSDPVLLKSDTVPKTNNSKPLSRSQILNKPIKNIPKQEPQTVTNTAPIPSGGMVVKRSIQHKINGNPGTMSLNNTSIVQPTQNDTKSLEIPKQEPTRRDVFKSDNFEFLNPDKQEFSDLKNGWHVLVIKSKTDDGSIKVTDNNDNKLIPIIKLPSPYFMYSKNPKSGENEYRIYVYTDKCSKVFVYSHQCNASSIKLQSVDVEIVKLSVDVYKMRRFYDIEFCMYYTNMLKLNMPPKTLETLKSDNILYKNINCFDEYIQKLKLDLSDIKANNNSDKTNVLYLLYSSIEYEHYGYTIRSHYLLKNTNNDKYNLLGVTRYGYPFDKEPEYYGNAPQVLVSIDDIQYIKLLFENDNYKLNTLIEYLQKYIIAVIKLAHKMNAKIIHGTTNFWNGIAAYYAAKYLGIKSVYEIRGFWDESTLSYRSDVKNSNYLEMIVELENKIINSVDHVITINKLLKDRVVKLIDDDKCSIVYNGVDTDIFKHNDTKRNDIRKKLDVNNNTILIGYIGTLANYEGLDYVADVVKMLLNDNINVKFVIAGDGVHKKEIIDYVTKTLNNNFIYVGKIQNDETIAYYSAFDIIAYPRKNNLLCNTTSSYKVFEAMSMMKPIIVSDLNAWREIITNNETGLICEADNKQSLYEKCKLLIRDKSLCTALGTNAREWIINNREWSSNGNQLRDIYDSLLK